MSVCEARLLAITRRHVRGKGRFAPRARQGNNAAAPACAGQRAPMTPSTWLARRRNDLELVAAGAIVIAHAGDAPRSSARQSGRDLAAAAGPPRSRAREHSPRRHGGSARARGTARRYRAACTSITSERRSPSASSCDRVSVSGRSGSTSAQGSASRSRRWVICG